MLSDKTNLKILSDSNIIFHYFHLWIVLQIAYRRQIYIPRKFDISSIPFPSLIIFSIISYLCSCVKFMFCFFKNLSTTKILNFEFYTLFGTVLLNH